jgi:uncharacterized protein YecA (UPF0149 family)
MQSRVEESIEEKKRKELEEIRKKPKKEFLFELKDEEYISILENWCKGEMIKLSRQELKTEIDRFISAKLVATDTNREVYEYKSHLMNKIKLDWKNKKIGQGKNTDTEETEFIMLKSIKHRFDSEVIFYREGFDVSTVFKHMDDELYLERGQAKKSIKKSQQYIKVDHGN